MEDLDTAQCLNSQRYGDKMILPENTVAHFMKMCKLRNCTRANKTMEPLEKVLFGTLGTNPEGKETATYW